MSEDVQIRRLGWAGIEVEAGGRSLLIDLLEDLSPMAQFIGEPHTDLPPPRNRDAAAALVTHLHGDHTDAPALSRALAPGAVVLRPEKARGAGLEAIATLQAETGLAETGVATRVVEPWDRVELDPFTVTAVPAEDGFGDPQVSWVVEAGSRRILHAGDTIWHGSWWLIAMRHGPFDAVFLPVNGAMCDFPHRQPKSPFACSLDPAQAAAAAKLLGATVAVPIHYDTIHHPPVYAQADRPAEGFEVAARELGVETQVLEPGDTLEWRA